MSRSILPQVLLSLALAAGVSRCGRGGRGAARVPGPAFPRDPDVVLVTIDTLGADALGFSGNRRVETPVLDRLAREGWTFRNAHAHNVVTLPSHANILTGLLPYQHGVRDNSGFRLDRATPTIATFLKERGYATGAFVGAFPLDSRFGLTRGFDVYDDRYPKGRASFDFEMPERPASEVIGAAAMWWNGQAGRPRFLWAHLYDCHAPYRPPAPFAERYRDDPYLGEVAAVDAALAPLLSPLLDGKGKPVLIVVTSDHGEARGSHGEETHGLFAYEPTLHVPLIVWMRGTLSPRTVDEPVRHADIAPTILAAAGVARPAGWTGSSILSPRDPSSPSGSYFEAYSAAFNRGWAPLRGVVGGGFKYVDLPVPELYDLRSDPGEAANIAGAKPDHVRDLARMIPSESAIDAARRTETSAADVRRLKSLGYLSGGAALKKAYGPEDDPKNLIGVDRDLHLSVDLYQRGELAQAVALAGRLVRERPAMSLGYENLGFLLRQAGQGSEALAVYSQAAARGVVDEELAAQYGLALCAAGRASEAVGVLHDWAESRDPDTLNALGIAYSDSSHPAQAVELFEKALAADPENVEAYQNLGVVRLRSEDPAGSRDFFRRALAIDPRLPRAWNGLGVALARLGNDRDAIDSWTRAVALDPKLYDALYNLGLTAGKTGRRPEARHALRQFIATAPRAQYAADIVKARQLLAILGTGS